MAEKQKTATTDALKNFMADLPADNTDKSAVKTAEPTKQAETADKSAVKKATKELSPLAKARLQVRLEKNKVQTAKARKKRYDAKLYSLVGKYYISENVSADNSKADIKKIIDRYFDKATAEDKEKFKSYIEKYC